MKKTLNPRMLSIPLPFPDTVALAASGGFTAIEFNLEELYNNRKDFSVADIRSCLREHRVELAAISGLLPGRLGCGDDEWNPGMARLAALTDFAVEIAAKRTTIVTLPFHETLPFNAYFDLCVERLRHLADRLDPAGISVGVEYVSQQSRRAASKFPFIHSLDALLALLRVVDRARIGILLDSFHWHCAQENRLDIEALRPERIVVAHLADAPDKPIAEQAATIRELPGSGIADLRAFMSALDAIGFDGPVICEPFHKPFEGMEPRDIAARVSAAIDSVWERGARK